MPPTGKFGGTLTQWTNERQGLHRLFNRHGRQPSVYGLLPARVGFVLEFIGATGQNRDYFFELIPKNAGLSCMQPITAPLHTSESNKSQG